MNKAETEQCEEILKQCENEINSALEKYNVTLEADQFYNGCWVQLRMQGKEPYRDKFDRERFHEYVRKI